VYDILQTELKFGYSGYVGALPVLAGAGMSSDGYWHRDAYSLYEDEDFDIKLPPFYYTMLVPLDDLEDGQGVTEFCLGSHKFNFTGNGISTNEKVKTWAETQPKFRAAAKAGSVILFDGHTLHRGTANADVSQSRNAL